MVIVRTPRTPELECGVYGQPKGSRDVLSRFWNPQGSCLLRLGETPTAPGVPTPPHLVPHPIPPVVLTPPGVPTPHFLVVVYLLPSI